MSAGENIEQKSISDPSAIQVGYRHYSRLMRELREHGFVTEANVRRIKVQLPDTSTHSTTSNENLDDHCTSSGTESESSDKVEDTDSTSSNDEDTLSDSSDISISSQNERLAVFHKIGHSLFIYNNLHDCTLTLISRVIIK